MNRRIFLALVAFCISLIVLMPARPGATASVSSFSFTTGDPDGRMAAASRPDSRHKIEIEAADDFILASQTSIDHASFTGLLNLGGHGEIREVTVEIYRVFPQDSDTGRTPQVPTRMNSPSDNALTERSSADGTLTYTVTVVNPHFEAANSVIDGIHPSPDQVTGGEGPVVGQEVLIEVQFDPAIDLAPDHYFFVPQVKLQGTAGNFLWLSAPGPPLFTGDLQMWIRNADLDPDWLRVGGDIVGPTPATGPRFNGSFSLSGTTP